MSESITDESSLNKCFSSLSSALNYSLLDERLEILSKPSYLDTISEAINNASKISDSLVKIFAHLCSDI